jgi:aromatic ring-cleaving dioxygenase
LIPGAGAPALPRPFQAKDKTLDQPISAATATETIVSYHAHIYYRSPEERAKAEQIREQIAARFVVRLGRWHDKRIGPHAAPMYQVAFATEVFSAFVRWLMLNRQGLVILLHPNTGAPRGDHLVRAIWYGEVLPIMNPEQLPETSDEDEAVHPNTTPGVS